MKKFLMMALACMGILMFSGCSDTPQSVAKKWAVAISNKDVTAANKHSTEKTHFLNAVLVEAMKKDNQKTKKNLQDFIDNVSNAKIDVKDDKTILIVESGDKGVTQKIPMAKVDGQWKVDTRK